MHVITINFRPKKRKIKSTKEPSSKKTKLKEISKDLNVQESEELAIMLLNRGK